MRITNKIMQKNSLININNNKIMQDKLNTQMSTQKKITRPSDDPVIAIRALRLRTNVSQVTQYLEKNSKDAESWLNLTEDAINTLTKVLTDLRDQAGKGVTDTMETSNRLVILKNMQALKKEVYAIGDSDYAGRTLFTGFRTDSKLTFQKEDATPYSITQQFNKDSIKNGKFVKTDDLLNPASSDYTNMTADEHKIEEVDIHRIRLAYKSTDNTMPVFSYTDPATGATVYPNITVTSLNSADPYTADPNGINFIPETGELIIGKNVYQELNKTKDDPTTPGNEGEFRVTYSKSSWEKGDLRPEHYFACKSNPGVVGKEIDFNADFLTSGNRQYIEYNVGSNQTIRVNTNAEECFSHDIGRDIDELEKETNILDKLDGVVKNLENVLAEGNLTPAEAAAVEKRLVAAKKAQTLQEDKVEKMFGSAITSMEGYFNDARLALTDVGSKSKRLELVQNRLTSQQANFKTLASANEDADIAQIAIELGSVELAYQAALMATGKISQTTLMDFI